MVQKVGAMANKKIDVKFSSANRNITDDIAKGKDITNTTRIFMDLMLLL